MKSVVNPSRTVSEDYWVVSLVAKPKGRNPEHAILLVEGETNGKAVFRRYDFFVDLDSSGSAGAGAAAVIQSKSGLVVIKERTCDVDYDQEERVDFFWTMMMKDRGMDEGCEGLTWGIDKDSADKLHAAVDADRENPPDYQISGQSSFFASSSSQHGHNCYTWARKKLRDLNVDDINQDKRLDTKLKDLVAARTTEHIAPPEVKADPSRRSLGDMISRR